MRLVSGWWTVTVAVALVCGACGGTDTVRLEFLLGVCPTSVFTQIDSAQARIDDLDAPAGSWASECVKVSPSTVVDLQQALRGRVAFLDRGPGAYAITVFGYDASDCKDVILCARARFVLPLDRGSIPLPAICHEGSSAPPEFAQCTSPP